MFGFGESFGLLSDILAARGIPRTLVTLATWKLILQVPKAKDGREFCSSFGPVRICGH